jgi:biopolymer transport protein ExbB
MEIGEELSVKNVELRYEEMPKFLSSTFSIQHSQFLIRYTEHRSYFASDKVMSNWFELVRKGGPVMVPIVSLSVVTLACAFERGWFWWRTLQGEQRLVRQILLAAQTDLGQAQTIAQQAQAMPIGRFLLAALQLYQPTPETLRLAMEASGDREFVKMRKSDKLLETIVGIAPLLGLLGTVTGLITTFFNLKIGGGGGSVDTTQAAAGIAEALIATAGGMIVAILALAVFRVCTSLQSSQIDYFADVGNEFELIYRQLWYEPRMAQETAAQSTQGLLQQIVELLQANLPHNDRWPRDRVTPPEVQTSGS